MATKDGRSQIWYADGNGNVAGYTESVDDIAGTIIDTYNEHFGTDISIWTPETINLQMGDTVPNWNAYEKIEITETTYVKYYISQQNIFLAGYIDYQNKKLKIWSAYNGQAVEKFDKSGKIIGPGGDTQWNNDFLNAVFAKGINVESAELEDIPQQPDNTIQNWEEYIEV